VVMCVASRHSHAASSCLRTICRVGGRRQRRSLVDPGLHGGCVEGILPGFFYVVPIVKKLACEGSWCKLAGGSVWGVACLAARAAVAGHGEGRRLSLTCRKNLIARLILQGLTGTYWR
jgi:hypothetical protein